jgi:hypothetical protein
MKKRHPRDPSRKIKQGLQSSGGAFSGDTLHSMVFARANEAVSELIKASTADHLVETLKSNTHIDALIHLVSGEPAAVKAASEVRDPLRAARARAAKKMAELLSSEGGVLGVEEVAKRLRITRAAVDKRKNAGTLIGIEDGRRGNEYPAWQFTDTGVLGGLDTVLKAMTVRDPWMRIQFFLSNDDGLGTTPLAALRDKRVDEVMSAGRSYGSSGEDG